MDLRPPLRVVIVVIICFMLVFVPYGMFLYTQIESSSLRALELQGRLSTVRVRITSVAHNIFQLTLSLVVLPLEELFLYFV